jgi:hypothetical protein
MLSTNSLSAFSSAATTAPLNRPGNARLVREQAMPQAQAGSSLKNAIPNTMPSIAPPRGSLLNLSV